MCVRRVRPGTCAFYRRFILAVCLWLSVPFVLRAECCSPPPEAEMSYYNNGPRIFTPSALKTSKSFVPAESFGPIPDAPPPPEALNTCHKSRGLYLNHTHPCEFRSLPYPCIRESSSMPPSFPTTFCSSPVCYRAQIRTTCCGRQRRGSVRASSRQRAARSGHDPSEGRATGRMRLLERCLCLAASAPR